MRTAWTTLALALLVACPETDGTPAKDADPKVEIEDGMDPNGHTPEAAANGTSFDFTNGEVLLSGTVSYEGEKTGRIRLDLLTQEGIAAPMLVSAEEAPALGPFQLKVPKGFGQLHILGFIDAAGDGPSPDDPAGKVTIEIGEVDIEGLELVLSEDPDLGVLRPGPPPEGQDGGPPGGAPPEGLPDTTGDAPAEAAPAGDEAAGDAAAGDAAAGDAADAPAEDAAAE